MVPAWVETTATAPTGAWGCAGPGWAAAARRDASSWKPWAYPRARAAAPPRRFRPPMGRHRRTPTLAWPLPPIRRWGTPATGHLRLRWQVAAAAARAPVRRSSVAASGAAAMHRSRSSAEVLVARRPRSGTGPGATARSQPSARRLGPRRAAAGPASACQWVARLWRRAAAALWRGWQPAARATTERSEAQAPPAAGRRPPPGPQALPQPRRVVHPRHPLPRLRPRPPLQRPPWQPPRLNVGQRRPPGRPWPAALLTPAWVQTASLWVP
mmetsp:Transcript_20703/g.57240  ORF Transcript_20703/g.57240 Transcript_20703/m.57240 type:complete len:269 (-) Transcript_20703:1308-2114(-)